MGHTTQVAVVHLLGFVTQENPMRYVIAATVAYMLVSCAAPPPSQGSGCSSSYECEVQAYARAGGGP
jgi:hypothetical protein